ncbi:MAG: MFS transporter [Woeseiaceae bacterium]|jgi:MFS family permease|nr:MFS transporter [Woeseiaceae bacterium]|tara:strand:+ start:2184 stop:3428 length:1245 start_codon:yes stop_codon:yes gene_type:complete
MAVGYGEFRLGWKSVFASAVGIGLGLSPLPFYTIGVFVAPFINEFGWSVEQIMRGLPILIIGALIMSPVAGYLADKYGVRKVVLTSIPLFSLSMMSFSLNNGSMVIYLLCWGSIAVTGAGTLPVTWTRAVNSWFIKRRGLALGMSLIGTGLFGPLAKIYAATLIELFGWRFAYFGVGLLPLLIAFPIAWFLLHEATNDDLNIKDSFTEAQSETNNLGGMTATQALRDWRFWLLGFCFLPVSFAVGGPIPNLEQMFSTKGFSLAEAIALASFVGFPSVIIGRVLGGYLLDYFWAPAVAAIILSLPALSLFLMVQPDLSLVIAFFAMFLLGLAAGVEYDLMAYLVSRYFGQLNYSSIYGLLYGFFAIGSGFGPWVFANSYSATGSYDTMLKISAVLFIVGAIPLLFLGKYRDFEAH